MLKKIKSLFSNQKFHQRVESKPKLVKVYLNDLNGRFFICDNKSLTLDHLKKEGYNPEFFFNFLFYGIN